MNEWPGFLDFLLFDFIAGQFLNYTTFGKTLLRKDWNLKLKIAPY